MNVIDLIIKHEGFRSKPYRCPAGRLTIGYGRNLDDCGITVDEAAYLLRQDIDRVKAELSASYKWFPALSEPRQAVIISMAYNLGIKGFSEFKRMIAWLAVKEYDKASNEMLASAWAGQVGRRASELSEIMRLDKFSF